MYTAESFIDANEIKRTINPKLEQPNLTDSSKLGKEYVKRLYTITLLI